MLHPGQVRKINECWEPHHFREVIKRSELTVMRLEYYEVIVKRIRLVLDLGPSLMAIEMLEELAEDLEEKINDRKEKSVTFHSENTSQKQRILIFENSLIPSSIELTKRVFAETGEDYQETARRLGIKPGLVANRLRG